ncbi:MULTISPECIES: hypothetical protein [unclassified Agrococcus]|uniref:hypothetical protein n=1 Tax=unclassified Agrococcus TaxID=2615065 RepID=UPI00360A8F49
MPRHRLRSVRLDDWHSTTLLRASAAARTTGFLLHFVADDQGRAEATPTLLLAALWPKRSDPLTEREIETHLLELAEVGFLTLYVEDGRSLLQITETLRIDRPSASDLPAPREPSRSLSAVGGAGEQAVQEPRMPEPSEGWRAWRDEHERELRPPEVPLELQAPPIGCPEHPNGLFTDCGPCGTARRQRDLWMADALHARRRQRYVASLEDEEPF